MSNTLFDATLALAKILPWNVVESSATGGATTTLIDTGFPWYITVGATNSLPPDDYYNGGTLFFKSHTHPTLSKTTAIVTDWVSATTTFTYVAVSDAPHAGDTYAVVPRDYPRNVLRRCVNQALADIGGELLYNVATTTVSDQMSFDLPSGVYNVKTIEIACSSTSPYGYIEHHHWHEVNDDIYFDEGTQPGVTGNIIRIGYQVPLSELTADTSALPDQYNMDMVVWTAAVHALRWKMGMTHDDEPWLKEKFNEALAQSMRYQNLYMKEITRKPRAHQYSVWAGREPVD